MSRARKPAAAKAAQPAEQATPDTTAREAADASGGSPDALGSSVVDGVSDEVVQEDHARQAEAVTPPGGQVTFIPMPVATVESRPDDAHPGTPMGGFMGWPAPVLRVRAINPAGFRRAGRYWPHAGAEISADEFTIAQLETLTDEPELIVTVVEESGDE